MRTETLEEALRRLTAPGALYEVQPDGAIHCYACGHHCRVKEGRAGICKVRYNEGGVLRVPWGYVGSLQLDPVEKKPFFHALPGSAAFSFGMLGCDYRCDFCQNWLTSQALRDPAARGAPHETTPRALAEWAASGGAKSVVSTYNEPLITAEWAVAVFKEAKKRGLRCGFVSNGNGTPQVLGFLRPWLDFYKVDLKGFDDGRYRRVMGGALARVLETIEHLAGSGVWLEVVTLVIPGLNDSDEELRSIARFLARLSPDIPWHVTAFHQDYRMVEPQDTPAETLMRAADIGRAEGLRYVYAGNLPGEVGDWENTRCPGCRELLVARSGYRVTSVSLRLEGSKAFCPSCAAPIPGVWR